MTTRAEVSAIVSLYAQSVIVSIPMAQTCLKHWGSGQSAIIAYTYGIICILFSVGLYMHYLLHIGVLNIFRYKYLKYLFSWNFLQNFSLFVSASIAFKRFSSEYCWRMYFSIVERSWPGYINLYGALGWAECKFTCHWIQLMNYVVKSNTALIHQHKIRLGGL